MKQLVNGNFNTNFFGLFPLVFLSKTVLTSEKGNKVNLWTLHLTPLIAIGLVSA